MIIEEVLQNRKESASLVQEKLTAKIIKGRVRLIVFKFLFSNFMLTFVCYCLIIIILTGRRSFEIFFPYSAP